MCYTFSGDFMQRYFATNKVEKKFILDNKDLHHIKNVMRIKDNENIEVVFEEKLYKCKVNYNNGIDITIVDEIQSLLNDKKNKISIIVPVLKENKMDFILQKSTELGVDEIIPVITERTLVKLNDKENKKLDRWNRICKEASEQSMRLNIPTITNVKKINDLKNLEGLKIVCSTQKNIISLKKLLQTNTTNNNIYIIIGPEGGLSNNEEKKLNELGFISTSLGNNILRVETVPLTILSMINYENME